MLGARTKSISHHLGNPGMMIPLYNTNQQWLPMVSIWCRISTTSQIVSNLGTLLKAVLPCTNMGHQFENKTVAHHSKREDCSLSGNNLPNGHSFLCLPWLISHSAWLSSNAAARETKRPPPPRPWAESVLDQLPELRGKEAQSQV